MTHTDIFNKCIYIILKNEGGYVNHPNDPGGETNMGIAKKFYPDLDIKNLTRNQAILIYRNDYWNKMNLIGIYDENLILQIFDMGVNAGIKTAIKIIQRIVEAEVDGWIGDETTGLINNHIEDLTELYKQERKKYYFSLARRKPELQVFLSGWLNRVDHTKFDI
jgi:lysozyme family protein